MEPWLAVGGNAEQRADWNHLLDLTREAKELNRVNGMLVNRQLSQTQAALGELRGPGGNPGGVYGPGGQTMSAGPSRRFVLG
jgi:flagella synthesis protein FlgN